jgi:polyhydroxybutyrate depolymerase
MLRPVPRIAVLVLFVLAAHAAPLRGESGLYELTSGTYRVAVPPGWDGKSRLPLLLYMHGYSQTSADVMGDGELVAAVVGSGVLLVVPDGLDRTWSHVGSPSHARDDLAFLHAVVADARKRWPVDPARIVASGFSQGASMMWDLACHAADGFAAFLPISGDFWLPYPASCDSGPVNLRHIHGMNDTMVPMEGRPIRGGRFIQGDIGKSMAILRQTDRCGEEADRIEQQGELKCWIWSSCASGRRLELCLHGDGHLLNPQFLRDGMDWAFRLKAASGG